MLVLISSAILQFLFFYLFFRMNHFDTTTINSDSLRSILVRSSSSDCRCTMSVIKASELLALHTIKIFVLSRLSDSSMDRSLLFCTMRVVKWIIVHYTTFLDLYLVGMHRLLLINVDGLVRLLGPQRDRLIQWILIVPIVVHESAGAIILSDLQTIKSLLHWL